MTNEKLYKKAVQIVNDIIMMDEETDLDYLENVRDSINEHRAYSPKLLCDQDIYLDRMSEFIRYLKKSMANEVFDMLEYNEEDCFKLLEYARSLKVSRTQEPC